MGHEEYRGWYDRGYLPHNDKENLTQMITYRLDDSLPKNVLKRVFEETDDDEIERRRRFEKLLDNGYGDCVLAKPKCAEIVVENWKYHDGKRYRLKDWIVMPNHAHVSYDRPRFAMRSIIRNWKSYTSNRIKDVLGTKGDGMALWQAGYFDRYARDERHLFNMQCYIFLNPVKAGLVDDPFDWPYSSIHKYERYRPMITTWWRQNRERFWEAWER